MKPETTLLRSLPLLEALSPQALSELRDSADVERFGPGEPLFRSGDLLSELHLLLAGQVGATSPHAGDIDALVDVLLPVRPLCLPAVLLGLPAPTGAQTLTSGRLVTLSADRLRKIVGNDPGSAQPFLDYALREVQEQALAINALKLRSSSQRLAEYLLGLVRDTGENPARFVLPFEKRLLAARIGCSQENLSRAFAALRRFGVETQRGVVIVRDVQGLRTFASAPSHRHIGS
jgi:CRP/FNR family transcriptional regulator, transcriptional activator FtrB